MEHLGQNEQGACRRSEVVRIDRAPHKGALFITFIWRLGKNIYICATVGNRFTQTCGSPHGRGASQVN